MLEGKTRIPPVDVETLPDDLRETLEEQRELGGAPLYPYSLTAQPGVLPRREGDVCRPLTRDEARARYARPFELEPAIPLSPSVEPAIPRLSPPRTWWSCHDAEASGFSTSWWLVFLCVRFWTQSATSAAPEWPIWPPDPVFLATNWLPTVPI
jgi:hypothetical protein